MLFGASTFIWTSPFSNEMLSLIDLGDPGLDCFALLNRNWEGAAVLLLSPFLRGEGMDGAVLLRPALVSFKRVG